MSIPVIVGVVFAVMLWLLIRTGMRASLRIDRSSKASAAALRAIYDAMPPEAKARAAEAAREPGSRAQSGYPSA
jgi:hypothetical protein